MIDPKKTLLSGSPIFLIDGSSFLYRAYYGMRPLHTPDGKPVQAVYSFCRMIKKLANNFNPQYVALVWDSKGKTTRHEMFEDYKATRQAPPSDIFDQKEYIQQFADLVGIAQLEQSGLEADDLMYSLAKEQADAGETVVFVTSDKDMGQALTDKILMFDSFKDKLIDPQEFEAMMGFPVKKLPFYFSLLGDASDNIPGVRGIGKKTAVQLVNQFYSLEDMYARIDEIDKNRVKNALIENKDNAFLSRKLFLLQYNPTGLQKEDLAFDIKNWKQALPLFQELNFKSLIKEVSPQAVRVLTPQEKLETLKKHNFELVTTEQQLQNMVNALQEKKAFAVDTETDSARPLECNLVGVSFSADESKAYYVPIMHKTDELQLSFEIVKQYIKPLLEDKTIKKYLHNAKFDMLVFAHHDIHLQGLAVDSMLAANLVTPDWQRVGLKQLADYYFDEKMLSYADVVREKKLKNFSYVDLETSLYYSANDSLQTLKLTQLFMPKLEEQKQHELFYSIEMPLVQVLFSMEQAGIYFDVEQLKALDEKVIQELSLLEEQILGFVTETGMDTINLNSPKQMQELLFVHLQLPPQRKSKKGGYSTDREVLSALAKLHPVPGLVLKYRELFKLKSTYIDTLPEYVNRHTKRIHTSYSQTKVATGRLSSFNPNLQNIPASGYGIEVREAFKSKLGYEFISADYSQIELRVLAYLSKDEHLTNAFLQKHDIHAETAARLFEVSLDKVSHEQRQIGKRINFSILYGLTPFGLSKDLDISFGQAKEYIDKYFAQYPGVSRWMEKVIQETEKTGYVTTHWGRRREIPGIYEKNKALQQEAKRVAINTVAQGTAAEIMKQGMINLHNVLQEQNIDATILLQIHDELLIEVKKEQSKKAQELIKQELESVVNWPIPLVATIRSGQSWKDVTK